MVLSQNMAVLHLLPYIFSEIAWAIEIDGSKLFLGLIHTRHFDRQYCDKKIFLSHRYLKAKVNS
jgi:hypothetical protein